MLTNWAKEIGIYKEDQAFKYNKQQGEAIWGQNSGTYSSALKGLTGEQTTKVADAYSSAFANAKASGLGDTEAAAKAWESVQGTIQNYKNQNAAPKAMSSSSSSSSSSDNKYFTVKISAATKGGKPKIKMNTSNEWTSMKARKGNIVTIIPHENTGYSVDYITVNGSRAGAETKTITVSKATTIKVYYKKGGEAKVTAATGAYLKEDTVVQAHKGEGIMTAKETEAFYDLVNNYRKLAQFDNPLVSYMGTYGARVGANIAGAHMDDNSNNVTIAPGAVQIAVAQLNDKYDIEELANDVMNRMVVIANKSTNRGVNRR